MTPPTRSPSALFRTTAFRLASLYIAAFTLAAAVIIGVLFWQTNALLTRQVLQAITAEANGLAQIGQAGGPDALQAAVADRSRAAEPSLYFLRDEQNRKLAGNLSRWPPELIETPAGGLFRYAAADARERLAVGIAVPVAQGRLLVARTIEDQRVFVDRVRRHFLWGFGLLALVGVAGGILASRALLKRIALITRTSETIMAGDLTRRVPLAGAGDELDQLAGSLNAMLERIEQLMAGLKEVSDNIAHDLKTPLNRLRNRAEAALRDPAGPPAHREGLERTIEEADELIKTFNALLLIARLEAGAVEPGAETFDLARLARDLIDLYAPVAEESGLELELVLDGGHDFEFHGNRHLIGQAIANLIDNAIKYAAAGQPGGRGHAQRAGVALSRTGHTLEVVVADRGPGIAPAERERVLKRFVRLETSRTRPGTGLGLSLVAAVARLHGGSLRLEDNAPGLRAILSLPAPVSAAGARASVRP